MKLYDLDTECGTVMIRQGKGKKDRVIPIGKRGGCHLFRHTMATLMLEGGVDIRYFQAMLGHTDLKTTEIYTQVSIRQLKQIHTARHPARLAPSNNQAHTDESARAELLSTLDAEAEEDNEAENRL